MPDRSASAARVTAAPEPKAGSARASHGGSSGSSSGRLALDPGRVSVLLPLPLAGAYDYALPSDLELAPGDVVQVPLGTREVIGVVWDAPDGDDGLAADRLKTVIARYDVPPLPVVERRFVEWVANYTMAPAGAVLRMALSSPGALETPRPIAALRATANKESLERLRLTSARRRVLAVAEDGLARPTPELARAAGVSSSVVKGLLEAGALESVELPPPAAFAPPDATAPGPPLTVAQQEAAVALRERTRATEDGPPGFSVSLLDGVTGSGKTEVYFEAVAEALAAGRQVLVLLPEIALSAQWLARFEARFGVPPAQWHSDLPSRVRRVTWRAVAFGEARLVVGARSALFLPFQDLGLIVVDEEHEAAFKQEDGVIYHARDMAVVRARLGEFPIVLVSATPSLESVTNVRSDRYQLQHLPERHGSAGLPEITLIDMRAEKPPSLPGLGQSWLSPSLRAAVTETLAAGEQVLLFLNRRGYAPLTLCRACGHRLDCPNCTAWLVEHRLSGKLQCHHCGYWSALPRHCPKCEAEGSLAACGPGVERLADEVAALFPDARRALMSSDTVTGPESAAALVKAVQEGEVDLLIGTQIVAKGNHFPNLTCVGVIDADLGLGGGDLRAAERTYQLLGQVAGRAGRAERPGRVLIQTFEPDHAVMQALRSGDRERFLAAESETRQAAGLPPFGRLAALILSAPQPGLVDEACRRLARVAPQSEGVDVFGPASAPLAILRRQHRRRFLLRTRRDIAPQAIVRAWLAAVELPRQVRLRIDIDPYSFL